MADIKNMIEEIKKMTVVELNDLVKAIEEEFGVSAAAMAVAAPAAGGAAAAEEEKTEFNVVLTDIGANKIAVIKVVREITGLGLAESKALVEGAPKAVKEGVAKDAANEMAEKFKAAGAGAEAAEEKTEFNVVLTDIGANKIAVIKVVREITGLGLAESKAMVESAPGAVVKEAIAKEAAEEMVKKFAEAGAKAELK